MLRQAKVVGKFVEYHGEGAARLGVTDRATIANMAPEYGATMGFFPIEERPWEDSRATGRSEEQGERVHRYYEAQGMFGIPRAGACDYSTVLELDLGSSGPRGAGPHRTQERVQ